MRVAVTSIVDLERTAHNRLHEILRVLVRRHEVTVFSIQDWWKDNQIRGSAAYRAGTEDVLERVKIVPFTEKRLAPVFQEALAATRARRLLEGAGKFDAHFDYNTLTSGRAIGRALRRTGAPRVYDLADDLVAMVGESPQIPRLARGAARRYAQSVLDDNLAEARLVTVISETLARAARVSDAKARLVPNGVNTAMFTPEVSSRRKHLGLADRFVVGYVGVLREWVDFDPVLEGMKAARADGLDAHLLVVGEEGGTVRIRESAARLGIESFVHYTGTVPYAEVPEYVATMDVGLIPFKPGAIAENSLPLKLFEYMAVGKAVISTPIPAVRACAGSRIEYAADGPGFAAAFARVAAERDPAVRAARVRWVREGYSWESVGARVDDVITEAVRGA